MKICPNCQNTYTDDTLQFCLQDGTPLNALNTQNLQSPTLAWNSPESEPATVIRGEQMRINIQEPPQVTPPPSYQTNTFPTEDLPKKSSALKIVLGLFVGLIALVGIGGAGAWYLMNQKKPVAVVQNTNTGVNASNSNVSVNSNANVQVPNANVALTPTATPTPKPILKPAELEAAKKEVESTIYGWKSSAESHNLDANVSNYADTVDYYKGGKISKSKLKASKDPAYKKYDSIEIEIKNMKVTADPTGDKATVTFDKDWDFAGVDKDGKDVINRGSVQQQLVLNKVNGKWKIVSEKDVKVIWVDKGEEVDF